MYIQFKINNFLNFERQQDLYIDCYYNNKIYKIEIEKNIYIKKTNKNKLFLYVMKKDRLSDYNYISYAIINIKKMDKKIKCIPYGTLDLTIDIINSATESKFYKLNKDKLIIYNKEVSTLIYEIVPGFDKYLLNIFYGNYIGEELSSTRIYKIICKYLSRLAGKYNSTHRDINKFIVQYNIDVSIFDKFDKYSYHEAIQKYNNLNHFFSRKLSNQELRKRLTNISQSTIISPTDCRLICFNNIKSSKKLWIKGNQFTVSKLIQETDTHSIEKYGSIFVSRLVPQDYHRFHMPITGKVCTIKETGNEYDTVRLVAVQSKIINVYTDNKRIIIKFYIKRRGYMWYVIIGAFLVGSIVLNDNIKEKNIVQIGDEIGYFQYGGSTVVVVTDFPIIYDKKIKKYSDKQIETLVKFGDKIASFM